MNCDEYEPENVQIVVLMGGLGSRLGVTEVPKALIDVDGIPFFDYQLRVLKRWGFHKFLFLVGFQAECIEQYYGTGIQHGVQIEYSYDGDRQLGTGGAIVNAMEKLEDHFMIIYGDSFMDINYHEVTYRYFQSLSKHCQGLMTLFYNQNQFDRSNVWYQDQRIILYDKINTVPEMQYIDYGVSVLPKQVFTEYQGRETFDLAEVLTHLSKQGKLAPLIVKKRFYEIGRPEALNEFREYARQRFGQPHKAVFFDRDGVVNEIIYNDETEQLDSPFEENQVHYMEGVIDILRTCNKKGYYVFIVTNQPAAAKGKTSLGKLYDINNWIQDDLKRKGVQIDCINMCPHYPVGNQRTKEKFLIKDCNCRKPGTGLIEDIGKLYQIDWENSFMVGDSYTDILAGYGAGLRTVFLGNLKCDVCNRLGGRKPDFIIESVTELDKII